MPGLTLRGCLFELPTWVPLTSACDGSASGGAWATPRANEAQGSAYQYSRGNHDKPVLTLTGQVQAWPTPNAGDAKQSVSLGRFRERQMEKAKQGIHLQEHLSVAVAAARDWPTPRAGSATGGATGLDGGQGSRAMLRNALPEAEARAMCNGQLNPAWVELLMGWPIGWTDIRNSWGGATWPGWPMGMGPDQHPYEPPRSVAKGSIPDRAARLKACGNGVVPQQAAAAYAALLAMAAPFIHAAERTA